MSNAAPRQPPGWSDSTGIGFVAAVLSSVISRVFGAAVTNLVFACVFALSSLHGLMRPPRGATWRGYAGGGLFLCALLAFVFFVLGDASEPASPLLVPITAFGAVVWFATVFRLWRMSRTTSLSNPFTEQSVRKN